MARAAQEEERRMTVPLNTRQDIRELDAAGISRCEIARRLDVSRNTVARYADMADMSPAPPITSDRPHPATDAHADWIDSVLSADLGAPRKQRHTAKRIYDRLVAERGYEGSYESVRRHVAAWRRGHDVLAARGFLELEWAPGIAQVDFGNFRCVLDGMPTDAKLLVVTLPHSNSRYCVAMMSERSECLCAGLRAVFEWMGRAPTTLVLDNATEAGRMVRGTVTESDLFSRFRAHYRCSSRYCNPYSGNEKGSVENAVGFLRRNLLVPEPLVASLEELNASLRSGCDRLNASSLARDGRPVPEAMAEDLAAMLALPGIGLDAVRWSSAHADKRGYVTVCGRQYCAGPAWHDRALLVGIRPDSVEVLADRGRHVATLPRAWGEGGPVRNPASLVPALVARPRAFGESTIRRDMPPGLVDALDRLDAPGTRHVLRAISKAAGPSGFEAACTAAARILAGGRVPDEASCDMLARRVAAGTPSPSGCADLLVYDGFLGREVESDAH